MKISFSDYIVNLLKKFLTGQLNFEINIPIEDLTK
jgi:hypothetical protein